MQLARIAQLGLVAATLGLGCRHVAPAPLDPVARAGAFEARSLDDAGLHAFLASALGSELGSWPRAAWDARSLAAAALYFQPRIAVARAASEASTAAIETARARPNPTLALTPERASNPGTAVSPWIAALSFDWPIETAGKRGRRIDRAEAEATAAALALRSEAWALRHQVAAALLDVVAARSRSAALAREVETSRALVAALDARIERGAAAAGDAAPFRLAWLESERAYGVETARQRDALVAVAAAVGVPVRALDGVELVAPQPDASLASASREACVRRALFERADVLASLARYAAAEAALRLELARQWPDLHVGPGYQFDQGTSKWSVGLSLELPLLDRNDGPIAEAIAARKAAAADFDAVQARGVAEVEQALAVRDAAEADASRSDALAADRRANLDRVRAAARLGAADRVAELAAELEWLRADRDRADAAIARVQSLDALEAAVQPASRAPPIASLADQGGAP